LNRKTSQLGDANKIIFGIMKTFLNRSGGFVGSADEVQPRTSKKIKAPSLRRGTTTLPKLSTLSLLLAVVSGCQSGKLTHYTSPEVTGRVLAADTHQPLAHADVQRVEPETFAEYWSFGSPKGGTLLMEPVGARTDADGRFVLNSKSVIALFMQPGWSAVSVNYSHAGYESFQTNYTGTNITSQTSAGVPVVDVGDVLLQPVVQ